MEKFSNLCKSGEIENVRILLVSKTRPQYGVGVKYHSLGNNVRRTLMPVVSVDSDLAPNKHVRVLTNVSEIHPSLYALLAQAYEYTERWAGGSIEDFEDFVGKSTIGDLYVYRHHIPKPKNVIR